ncbi:MAG: hypothetical protein B7Z75_07185 [Acidocella sp. 20-57-95]|nr:MAG: hypothetical protein B7Z75_07185 [Acidocella sp. 20-57-95]HQT63541.1 hypothetical protein [Acidocella sp.]HQU05290.1 hypothetical protein [Acidocella sp.]
MKRHLATSLAILVLAVSLSGCIWRDGRYGSGDGYDHGYGGGYNGGGGGYGDHGSGNGDGDHH